MKKHRKKHNLPTEHYYIPLALILLNICLIHFLFALSAGASYTAVYKVTLGAALLALTLSLISKRQGGMLVSGLFYLLVLSGLLSPLLS